MAEAILNRYFKGGFNSFEMHDIVNDGITEALLRMHKWKEEKGSSFTFMQMIIKHFYMSKLVLKSKEKIMWREIMMEDPEILNPDTTIKHKYLDGNIDLTYDDHNMDVEIRSNIELIMSKLYTVKVEIESYLKKNKNKPNYYGNKKNDNTISKESALKVLKSMIKILESNPKISYERLIIEIYEQNKCDYPHFNRKLIELGFKFTNVYSILNSYTEYKYKKVKDNYHDSIDWVLDDFPVDSLNAVINRRVNMKKRNK